MKDKLLTDDFAVPKKGSNFQMTKLATNEEPNKQIDFEGIASKLKQADVNITFTKYATLDESICASIVSIKQLTYK